MPRAMLVVLREPHDPMVVHERRCFARASRLPIDDLTVRLTTQPMPTAGELRAFDAVMFGGSGAFSVLDDVPWIHAGLDLLRRVLDARVPAFASCFGFQGLAHALGGEVVHDPARTEMGSTEVWLTGEGQGDGLFGFLPRHLWVQEGHHDRVKVLPAVVTRLATNDHCPEQALKVEGAPFWASQFHPELTVQGTLDRFNHYAEHYLDADGVSDQMREILSKGRETPEVSEVLARLVRGEF